MPLFRRFSGLAVCIVVFALAACTPPQPRERVETAIATLQSDAGGSKKAAAAHALREAMAEYPFDTADRPQLATRAAAALVVALREPRARAEARETLISLGPPAYEPLFSAVLEGDAGTQDAAITCLIRMSNTAVPVLIPALMGDDVAAQDRAARILVRIGPPITATLRRNHATLLEPYAGAPMQPGTEDRGELSTRGKSGILAFARVFAEIGDPASVLALLHGADRLRFRYPELALEHLHLLDGLGPDALKTLNSGERRDYERMKLTLDDRRTP